MATSPEIAADMCGIPAERIRALARELAGSAAALSLWCQGLNQSSAGTDKINAVINLHLVTGQIGRPGAGPFSLTGQANAMGGREVGGLATELAAHHRLDDPEDRAAVERFWSLGPVPQRRGLTAVELVDAVERGEVKVLWVVATNPLASLPDGRAVRAAVDRLDLLVVQELYHPTDTSVRADVLLPAAGWGEKTGTLTSSERRVALAEAAVEPSGEARPDWEIFAAVGRALGGGNAFAWDTAAEVFAEHVELTRGRDLDMTGLSHGLLRELGPQHWPFPAGGTPQARRYTNGVYPTPDGRARLVPVTFRPPAEEPDRLHPFSLTTGRQRDQWHTLTRTGRVAALRRDSQEATVEVHPDDAREAGVEDGGLAMVSSPRGQVRARVRVDDSIRRGLLFMPFHRGPMLEPWGWVNSLTGPALDPVSFQPELKHTVAWLGPAGDQIGIVGGALARATAECLAGMSVRALLVSSEQLENAPDHVRRVVFGDGELDGVLAWWAVATAPEILPQGGGRAVLDLRQGPEPLTALPALLEAGFAVQRNGDGQLPREILRILDQVIPSTQPMGGGEAVVVGEPERCLPSPVPQALRLEPGGTLGLDRPLSGDPRTLAAFLSDQVPARAALRRMAVSLGGRTLVVVGDTSLAPDADLIVHEDGSRGLAQVWKVASGQVLGGAAIVEPGAADDVEELWLADVEPVRLRSRIPVR